MCQVCQTPLLHRYLWSTGPQPITLPEGTRLADRYQVKAGGIVLDTRPGLAPEPVDEVPDFCLPYLQLSDFPLHVPRPYALVPAVPELSLHAPVVLLEEAAISTTAGTPEVLPGLAQAWATAPGLRQLNWLWQMARLWQPCVTQGVGTTLLTPDVLRVDGALIKFLELRADANPLAESPQLLGSQWQSLIPAAHASLRPYLERLCDQLSTGHIATASALVAQLERALLASTEDQTVTLALATYTDQGPTRQRNEDACYPDGGTATALTFGTGQTDQPWPLMIVCDGIGGHEGGDVASHLAITTICQELQSLRQEAVSRSTRLEPATVTNHLHRAIRVANDAIAQRNDREQRQARERMGTTLVTALIAPPFLYIAHVGDSRAYRITAHGCRQVTLDDDVATREMRLGYGFYQQALQQPSAGSLIQALGMGSSQGIYPTVQHFLLEGEALFLLCSDGLSDNDRVESFWQIELQPILAGKRSVKKAGQHLIDLANLCNGHDNVTVGLLQLQPAPCEPDPQRLLAAAAIAAPEPLVMPSPEQVPPPAQRLRTIFWGGLLALGVGAGAGLWWWHWQQRQALMPRQSPTALAPAEDSLPRPSSSVSAGKLLQVKQPMAVNGASGSARFLEVHSTPTAGPLDQALAHIPPGSILKVEKRQVIADSTAWISIVVCSVPGSSASPESASRSDSPGGASTSGVLATPGPPLGPGDQGWIPEATLMTLTESTLTTPACP
ncbi:Protein serin-threonin phosphatase [Halomicronema hongdechloris C2206]|uniref:Protein serin-threonin phosphatase n=1 Tax=Halomicronema hongdechloris C2206 TaxID=1641165 RepID=A0A1Z3HSA5_9CYAN|nr:protein phosphatase 2C domain-containing protein [Halomicronema hongdechloris]ASC73193.1 Protein serin-threonin phosphatase [Halomicronema hongdechloris C2206]